MRELPVPDTGALRDEIIGWVGSVARSLSTRRNVALWRNMAATPEAGADSTKLDELPIGRRAREFEAMLNRAKKGAGKGHRSSWIFLSSYSPQSTSGRFS